MSNQNYCAAPTSTAARTGPNGTQATAVSKSSGLSTGAKAGIGAGLAVGALFVIGGFLWFCVVHRRHARERETASEVPAMSQVSGSAAPKPPGQHGSDYFGPAAVAGPFTSDHTSHVTSPGSGIGVPISPQSPGDFQIPVEIDSRGHSNTQSTATTPGNFVDSKGPGTAEYPVELP